MIKKIAFVTAGVAAGMTMLGGFASAEDVHFGKWPGDEQGHSNDGLVNVTNVDLLHNVNANVGVCDNNINVLGVQVVVEDVANGLNVPILSPGVHEAEGSTPENCASASSEDGGTVQDD